MLSANNVAELSVTSAHHSRVDMKKRRMKMIQQNTKTIHKMFQGTTKNQRTNSKKPLHKRFSTVCSLSSVVRLL